jgi:hypothetical protein
MFSYRDPVSNLFCVTFDNSSNQNKYFKNVQNIDKANLTALMKGYVQDQTRSAYFTDDETIKPQQIFYDVGDYIRIQSATNDFNLNGIFFVNNVGPFGECSKTKPVQFLMPVEKITCGNKIVNIDLTCRRLLTNVTRKPGRL